MEALKEERSFEWKLRRRKEGLNGRLNGRLEGGEKV